MRIGELAGLCWDRVDFNSSCIEVSRTLGRNGLKESTKTNLIRYIPMNTEVKKIFEDLNNRNPDRQYIFVDEKNRALNPDHYSKRHFQKALKAAGVRTIKFHDLRHTYASHFMMNGGNIYDLQKILGHTKVDMTMKYAHLSPQHLKGAVETVSFSVHGSANKNSPNLAPRDNLASIGGI